MFETLAKNRYEAFIRGIQFIGARIPTQAMQSFMPLIRMIMRLLATMMKICKMFWNSIKVMRTTISVI